MRSVNAASNNQQSRSNSSKAEKTGSYFQAIWFNFSSTYYFGWLPEKLAIYMLYFFLGTLALILNPFSAFYQASAAAIASNSGVIGAELLNRFVTSGIVSVLFTFALRYLYKTIIKALSRCFAVDQGNALRNVSQTLIYYSRDKIISAIRTHPKGEAEGKAEFTKNNEQNYASGTRDVFGKCDYFLQSMCMSIFNFIVVATTLGPSVGLLSFSILGTCLIIANIAAYLWAEYRLAPVVTQNAENKPALTKCVSEVLDCENDQKLTELSLSNVQNNETGKKELIQTSKLDFIRGLMDTKFTQIIVTIALVSAGISTNYPLLVVMASQIAELMENGIPLLSQAQTMAQLSTTYGQTQNHFNYLKEVGAIPKINASNPMHNISETEYAMLYLKDQGKKQYLKDIVNTLQLTSSVAFTCFSLYQYLSFLGAYEMAYIMPQLVPSVFASFASTATAHLIIATGFILMVALAGAVINAGISLIAGIYQKNKTANAKHLRQGFRPSPNSKLSQSLSILLSFKHFFPQNPYNPIFATTWAFPILIVLTKSISALAMPVFSTPFLISFITLSVLLSTVANGLLTPSYNQYLSFENRINNNPSFKLASQDSFISASTFLKVKSAPAMHHSHVPSTTTAQNIPQTNAGRLREIAEIVRHPVAPSSSTCEFLC